MKRIFFFILLIFSIIQLVAQTVDEPLRIELPTAQDAYDYQCTLMGEKGLLITYEGEQRGTDSLQWVILPYDTNFIKQDPLFLYLPHVAEWRGSYYDNGKLYMIFLETVGRKEKPRTFITCTDLQSRHSECFIIESLPKFTLSSFKAYQGNVFFSIIYDDTYYVYFYSIEKHKLNEFVVPDAAIISDQFIEVDTFNQKVLLGLGLLFSTRVAVVAVFETNFEGALIEEAALPVHTDYYYNSLRYHQIDSASAIIIGTYNIAKDRKSGFYHSGVYTIRYDNSKMGEPIFYNYANLGRKDSSKTKSAKEISLEVQLLVGDILANDSCFSLITEVYYSEYTYSNNYYDNSSYYYGGGYNPAVTTFQGYRYVNGFVTCFNRQGELMWDNYFPFENMLTRRLAKRMLLYYAPFGTAIFYPYNASLTCTLVDGYEVIEKMSTIPIETRYRKDVVEYSRDINMYNWYANNFVIVGYQSIVNNTKSNRGHRYVFFVNKLRYE